jgi:filamentous hemagglutinin
MDVRHPLYQAIASALAGVLILNPIVAAAAELAVDTAAGGNTHLGAAGNGVPIVNIATPNGAGLSHNKFTDFNVGSNGLILNNATQKTQSTQLGGIIIGNPNLKGGAASKILNEVTSNNPAQLRGYTEVAGQSAHVIVAAPGGVTCSGCGFINTPRVTLTTGKPLLDGERLQGYDVNGGEITLDGAGLNASNVDRFELITRSTKLNADLYAKQLSVVTGRNQVDAETLAATPKADDGSSKPQLAIDSAALGGMYANTIRLVGTEQGVGVKLAGNMAASAGDIQIDANGQLSLAQTSAAGSLRARAQDITLTGPTYAAGAVELNANGTLTNQNQLAAGSRIALTAAQLNNTGIVEAGVNPDNSRNTQGDVAITAQNLRNSGSVVASRDLALNSSGAVDNQGGSLRGSTTTLTTSSLNNHQGRLLANSTLSLVGQQLSNLGGQVGAQVIQVRGGLLDNRFGLFSAEQALSLDLTSLDNSSQGTLSSRGALTAQVSGTLNNSQGGSLVSDGAQQLRASQLLNQNGTVSSRGQLDVQASATDNRGGRLVTDAALNLSGAGLDNRDRGQISAGQDLQLNLDSLTNTGAIQSDAALRLTARTVSNTAGGQIAAKGDLSAQLTEFAQNNAQLLSEGHLQLQARQIDNHQGGWIGALQGIALQADTLFNQGGDISSRGALTLVARQFDNSAGQVSSDAQLTWQGNSLVNRGGNLVGQGALSLNGRSLDNSQGGTLSGQQGLALNLTDSLNNQAGKLLSEGNLNLSTAQFDNRAGVLSAAGPVSVASTMANNQGGQLVTDSSLAVTAPSLDNRQGGVLSAKGLIDLRGSTLLNSQSGRILGGADLLLAHTRVDNSDHGRIEAAGRVRGQVSSLDQHGAGQLVSSGGIDLDFAGGSLDNSSGGLLTTPGGLLLRNLAQLNNSAGGEVSSQQNLALQLTNLNNQGGKLLSEGALILSAGSIDNRQGGWLGAGQGIALQADSLLNQRGEISSRGNVSVAADQLDNSAGRIATDSLLSLQGDNLANRGGTLIGQGGVNLTGRTLDNSQGGQVSSEGTLSINADQLDNGSGVLSSGGVLAVTSSAVNNQRGKLLTDAALTLNAQTLDNRQGGVLSSKGNLTLRGATLLNSQSGRILSGADLLLALTRVDNSEQGRIEAAGRVTGQLQSLDQHQGGQLLGNGGVDLDFAGGSLDNSSGGLLTTPGALLLRNLAQLNNSTGGEISSQQSFALSLSALNNQGGRILSNDALTLQVQGAADNSQRGVLFGRNQLQLTAQNLNNSQGGTVASQGAVQATIAGALDNHGDGALAATGKLTLNSASLNNAGGSLSAGQDLRLVTGTTDNQQGRITAQGALDATTGDLDNRSGILSGRLSQQLQAQAIDNRTGLITSQGLLDLTASRVDNGQGGELSAGGTLQLHVQQLIQQQGQLISGGDLALDLAGGDFDNRNGVLSVGGLLRLDHLRNLDNRGGEISSQQSFAINASGSLDNGDAGRIISAGQLDLKATTLRNANQGLLSGWQGLAVQADRLDNSASGTLSSKQGTLDLTLSGALDNHDQGALVSQGDITLKSGSLNNANGIVSTQGNLGLTLAGDLDNSAGGLLSAQGSLTGTGQALDNRAGQISANGVALDATGLDNSGGSVVSQGALRLGLLGALLNVGAGSKLASAGPLTLKAGSVDNRGGQLASQDLLSVLAGRFDNSAAGTLAALNDVNLNLSGDLLNGQDGLIFSKSGQLTVRAERFDNTDGTLQGQGDTTLTTQGAIVNQSGRISSQGGSVAITSASLDNDVGGVLTSLSGALKLVTGWFGNHTGITQAQSLEVQASVGIDNRSGHLSAVSGNNQIVTAQLDNQNGGLYAGQSLMLSGDSLLNQGGKVGAGSIDFGLSGALNNQNGLIESSGALSLRADTIDNQSGAIRALGKSGSTNLNAGYLDNRLGRVETANSDLLLTLGGLANTDGAFLHVGTGQFGINAGRIAQAGGSFVTTGHLDITADSWSNSSVLQAGWLTLNIGQFTQTASGKLLASQALTGRGSDWSNAGLLASDGSLDIQLTGTYSGAGRVTSLGALNFAANRLDLAANGSIAGGQDVTLTASQLDNHGRITAAGELTANAATLNNYGTLGSAGKVQITADDLLNDGQASGALLFSGADLRLQVGNLINRYADVYSLGKLDVTGTTPSALAGTLKNISATLESLGDMRLRVGVIENRTDVLSTTQGELISAEIGVRCFDCASAPEFGEARAPASHLVWVENYRGQLSDSSPSAAINAGGNLRIEGQSLLNQASTIAAVGNIAMTLERFTNQGVAIGDYSVRRSFDIPYDSGGYTVSEAADFWDQVMAYNAANDPEYDSGIQARPYIHFWDRSWNESLEQVTIRAGGREADRFGQFGSARVYFPGASPFDEFEVGHYQPGALVDAPVDVKNATFFDELTVQSPGSSFVNAVVQAGGNVAINASQDLTNSVIREGVPQTAGTSRVGDTAVSGSAATVVALNAQLPPDLAQQQVNPISLPGFSLPQGQNGLFRLSGQEAAQGSAQAVSGGASYSFAGQSISLSQRERAIDSATGTGAIARGSDALGGSDIQRVNGSTSGADNVQLGNGAAAQNAGSGAALSVAQVQGVPSSATPNNSQKYLIETNPELTSLKSFLSSDYLLGQLGYDPDQSQKRLGDGLYEQRLIQQAVVARTGQRFIDGISSDEELFRYLMNNAIAYKDSLHLTVGVALTAEQVAALTHDIVWLEDAIVNGEHVLVPVLYLAQANNRLAPNGALIAGNDLTLISGGDLSNQGILHASNNLSAVAGNLDNSGLIEAGGRLDLLAQDNLTNSQGGILKGRDVSLGAISGDVLNQRDITVHEGKVGNKTWTESFADSASRIESAGNLDISAGRDISNLGGTIRSGSDLSLQAGRDVNLGSVGVSNGYTSGRNYGQTTTQLGSEVSAGRDFTVDAGRDIGITGSQIDVGRDAGFSAGRDFTLSSSANEQHSYYQDHHVTAQEDHVHQQGSALNVGGDVLVSAGENITLKASKIGAGDEAYLVAGDQINVVAANDTDYSLHDKKDSGSFGQKSSRHDEVTDVKAVGSEITAGSDISLISGGDQTYQGAKLDSGNDIAITSGGGVTFEAVKDQHQEAHEKTDNSFSWNSSKGSGKTDETVRQSQLIAQGNVAIKAVDGLHIDYKHIDQQSVSQAIDAMVQADPSLAWLKEAEARGDVTWRGVKEVHDSYSYSHSGLGAGAQLVIAIIVAYFTAGAASGLVASGASAAGASTAAGSAWAAGVGSSLQGIGWANAAATAALTGAASNTAISTINNRGNLGAVASDVTSSDALRGYAVAGATAGLTTGLYNGWTGTQTEVGNAVQNGVSVASNGGLSSVAGVGSFAGNQLLQNGTSALLDRALGGNAKLSDALQSSLANTFAAAGFNFVGDITGPDQLNLADGSLAKIGLHAVMGGLAAEAAGGDFRTGALAAGVNEALVDTLANQYAGMDPDQKKSLLVMNSQLIGLLAAAAQGNSDADSLQTGAAVAGSATQYNYLLHDEIQARDKEIKGCPDDSCEQDVIKRYADLDKARNADLPGLCKASPDQCVALVKQLAAESGLNAAEVDSLRFENINRAMGIQLASESNDEAMSIIQQELIRNKYGDATAIAAMIFQAAASGNLGKNSKLTGAAKGTSSVVDAEKAALERIAQNPKGVDLAGKQPNSVLQQQSQNRINDLAMQYNTKSIEPKDFQLNLSGKVLKTDPKVSKGAPVYEGATTSDVMSYFKQLAGVESMPVAKVVPGKGTIYTATTEGGSKITLRDFSRSSQQTGASWTIDVMDKVINGGRTVEIKFK